MIGARWIGARLDLEPPFEPLLLGPLAAWFLSRRRAGRLRRWFFLRYSEEGLHLRVRLLPSRREPAAGLIDDLRTALLEASPDLGFRVQEYDRTALSFGETWESVLAERLHQATAELTIGLLRQLGDDVARWRWTLATGVAGQLLEAAVGPDGRLEALEEWSSFCRWTALRTGYGVAEPEPELLGPRLAALRALAPRLREALVGAEPAREAVWLLRRVRARGEGGRFVATHALHFFCNQMGLSIHQEYGSVASLDALVAERRPSSPAAPAAGHERTIRP